MSQGPPAGDSVGVGETVAEGVADGVAAAVGVGVAVAAGGGVGGRGATGAGAGGRGAGAGGLGAGAGGLGAGAGGLGAGGGAGAGGGGGGGGGGAGGGPTRNVAETVVVPLDAVTTALNVWNPLGVPAGIVYAIEKLPFDGTHWSGPATRVPRKVRVHGPLRSARTTFTRVPA
jgi:hypothetical protein